MGKRIDYLDTAKGICMLLIILGHCAADIDTREDSFLVAWVYSFHTTTFFWVTGMLMEHIKEYNRPFKTILVSNVKRLLIPYFLFQMLYSIWYCIINGFSNIKWLISDALLLVGWDYATWFLLALFISKMVVIVFYKTIKSHLHVNLLLLLLFLFSLPIIKQHYEPPFYWIYHQLLRTCIGIGFITMGVIFYKYKDYLNSVYILAVSLCTSLITSYCNGVVSTFNLGLENPVIYVASAICGAIFILSLSIYIHNRLITFFGKESIIAMGTHQLILRSFPFSGIYLWFIIVPLTMIPMYIYTIIKHHIFR